MLARLICVALLQIHLKEEYVQSMSMMKYAVNHPTYFTKYYEAFLIGFVKTTVVTLVNMVNIIYLLQTKDVVSAVENFVALVVICDFDNYLFDAVRRDPIKHKLCNEEYDDLLLKTKTTSVRFFNSCKVFERLKVENKAEEQIFCMKFVLSN